MLNTDRAAKTALFFYARLTLTHHLLFAEFWAKEKADQI